MNEYKNRLIEMVEAEPTLWNQRADAYHRTRNKDHIWEEIAKALNDDRS